MTTIVKPPGAVFEGNCPLWAYVLAEATQNKTSVDLPVSEETAVSTPQRRPVGGSWPKCPSG